MQKPIPAIPLQSDSTRPITPEERQYYTEMKNHYMYRCACYPCDRKLKIHYAWIKQVLLTGIINN